MKNLILTTLFSITSIMAFSQDVNYRFRITNTGSVEEFYIYCTFTPGGSYFTFHSDTIKNWPGGNFNKNAFYSSDDFTSYTNGNPYTAYYQGLQYYPNTASYHWTTFEQIESITKNGDTLKFSVTNEFGTSIRPIFFPNHYLSTETIDISNSLIYPNPVNDYLNISINGKEKVILTDLNGRIIFNDEIYLKKEIDLLNQPNGIYILQIGNQFHKILKQ